MHSELQLLLFFLCFILCVSSFISFSWSTIVFYSLWRSISRFPCLFSCFFFFSQYLFKHSMYACVWQFFCCCYYCSEDKMMWEWLIVGMHTSQTIVFCFIFTLTCTSTICLLVCLMELRCCFFRFVGFLLVYVWLVVVVVVASFFFCCFQQFLSIFHSLFISNPNLLHALAYALFLFPDSLVSSFFVSLLYLSKWFSIHPLRNGFRMAMMNFYASKIVPKIK